MSWLHFNDGLNLGNLKGQLTSLAGNVLQNINDGTASVVSNFIEDEQPDTSTQQSSTQSETQYDVQETIRSEEETPKDESIDKFSHLKKIIRTLEQEKAEYLQTLKQLDSEYEENILELATNKKELECKYKELNSHLETQKLELDTVQLKMSEEVDLRKKFEEKYKEKLIENQELVSEITNLKSENQQFLCEISNLKSDLEIVNSETNKSHSSNSLQILPANSCENCSKLVIQEDSSTQTEEVLIINELQAELGHNGLNPKNSHDGSILHNNSISNEGVLSESGLESSHLLKEVENQIHNLVKFSKHLTIDPAKLDQIDQLTSKLEKEDIGQLELLMKKLLKNSDNNISERENAIIKREISWKDLEDENCELKNRIEQLENESESQKLHLEKVIVEYNNKLKNSSLDLEKLQSETDILKEELFVALESQGQLQIYLEQVEDKYQRSKLEETALKLQNDHLRNELNTTSDKKQNITKEIVKCIQSFSDNMLEHIEDSLQNNLIEDRVKIDTIMENLKESSFSEENIENPVVLIEKRLEIFGKYVSLILKNMNNLNSNFRVLKEENTSLEKSLLKIFEFAHQNKIIDNSPESLDANSRGELIEHFCENVEANFKKHVTSENIIEEIEHLKIEDQNLKEQCGNLSSSLLEEQDKNRKLYENNLKIVDDIKKTIRQSVAMVKQFGIFDNQSEFKDLLKSCEKETSEEKSSDEPVEKYMTEFIKLIQMILAYLRNIWFAYENVMKEKDSLGRNMGIILESATKLTLIERPNDVSKVRPLDDLIKDLCEKLGTIIPASKQSSETTEEIKKLQVENNQLREKCTSLSSNLLQEQSNNQHLSSERSKLLEQEIVLTKKLERLQSHLIEVEEHYTKELVESEEKLSILQQKLRGIEQSERDSSNLYKSINIRANQKLEALQSQSQLLVKERDDLKKKLIEAEIRNEENITALKNLHSVLEQFQKDRDLDIKHESDKIRKETMVEKIIQQELKKEIQALKQQLERSKQGLSAASRLSDQLESSQQQVSLLKDEISELKERLVQSEKLNSTPSKKSEIEKTLLKNLIISAFSYNKDMNENQMQILRIIAHVLDFTEEDNKRLSQKESQSTWSKLFSTQMENRDHETLTQQFVKFLESESTPRIVPPFAEVTQPSNPTVDNRTASSSVLSDISLPTFGNFSEIRSSSSILKDVLKETH